MANLVKPGVGVVLPVGEDTSAVDALAKKEGEEITWAAELFMIIPSSFFKAAVENQVLAIVFCTVMFACSMMKADKKSKKVMLEICEALSQVRKKRSTFEEEITKFEPFFLITGHVPIRWFSHEL